MRSAMAKFAGSALLVLVMLVSVPASAQVSIELQGGPAFPTGDLNEYWGIGFTAGGTILYELTPFVSCGVNIGYSRLGMDTDKVKSEFMMEDWDLSGGDANVFSACAEVRAHAGAMDMATLFAGAGFGLFHLSWSDIEGSYGGNTETLSTDSENQPGGYLHAGAAIGLGPMAKLGIKCQYTMYQMKNEDLKETFDTNGTMGFFSVTGALIIGF